MMFLLTGFKPYTIEKTPRRPRSADAEALPGHSTPSANYAAHVVEVGIRKELRK